MPRAYSMDRRAAAGVDVRLQILEATLAELVAAGPEGLTLKGVAARADLSLRTLYNHYAGRDALLSAAFARHTADTRAAVEAVTVPDLEPAEQLRHVLESYYRRYAEMGTRLDALLAIRTIPDLNDQLTQIRSWRRRILTRIIDNADHAGDLRVPPSTAIPVSFTLTSHAAWRTLTNELGGHSPEAERVATLTLNATLFGGG
jgi:AcrR family transcriptional regulator